MILIINIKLRSYENIETGARKKFKKGQKVKGKNFKKLVFRWQDENFISTKITQKFDFYANFSTMTIIYNAV